MLAYFYKMNVLFCTIILFLASCKTNAFISKTPLIDTRSIVPIEERIRTPLLEFFGPNTDTVSGNDDCEKDVKSRRNGVYANIKCPIAQGSLKGFFDELENIKSERDREIILRQLGFDGKSINIYAFAEITREGTLITNNHDFLRTERMNDPDAINSTFQGCEFAFKSLTEDIGVLYSRKICGEHYITTILQICESEIRGVNFNADKMSDAKSLAQYHSLTIIPLGEKNIRSIRVIGSNNYDDFDAFLREARSLGLISLPGCEAKS